MVNIQLLMLDSFGDGWNGASITIIDTSTSIPHPDATNLKTHSSNEKVSISLSRDIVYCIKLKSGAFDNEIGIRLSGPDLNTICHVDVGNGAMQINVGNPLFFKVVGNNIITADTMKSFYTIDEFVSQYKNIGLSTLIFYGFSLESILKTKSEEDGTMYDLSYWVSRGVTGAELVACGFTRVQVTSNGGNVNPNTTIVGYVDGTTYEADIEGELSSDLIYQKSGINMSILHVDVGTSVDSISVDGFKGSESLVSVVLPNSIENIGISSFSDCSKLSSIVLSNTIKKINMSTFSSCMALKSIVLPKSITSIHSWAFSGCHALNSIVLPRCVNNIGNHAFKFCDSLTHVYQYDDTTQNFFNATIISAKNKINTQYHVPLETVVKHANSSHIDITHMYKSGYFDASFALQKGMDVSSMDLSTVDVSALNLSLIDFASLHKNVIDALNVSLFDLYNVHGLSIEHIKGLGYKWESLV